MPALWFIGGWGFALAFGGAVAVIAVLARREQRAIAARRGTRSQDALGRYERELLGPDGQCGAVRLAIVDLLHDGVLEPGDRWDPPDPWGGGRFALVAVRMPDADAHPLQHQIAVAVGGLPPLSAARLFRRLARGDAVARMRERLVDAGLLYGGHETARGNISFALLFMPYLAFFAWIATYRDDRVLGVGELILNVVAVFGLPLLPLAPSRWGPTSFGKTAYGASADIRDAVVPDRRARELTAAWESQSW